ncbi:chitinase-3-like protein 2 [Teleopsis dalmanni]|uniref:chitinase-3-like protein 2 n=1 Tax=Teleopsis dalmanni TaxID=139649 RepID=UPI0018CD4544|nr:chitinase-3-like protein 2 [Teleopsis dalmanni]
MVAYEEIARSKYKSNWLLLLVLASQVLICVFTLFVVYDQFVKEKNLEDVLEDVIENVNRSVDASQYRMVCYYTTPNSDEKDYLRLVDIKKNLCSHVNIGIVNVKNSTLILSSNFIRLLNEELATLRVTDPSLKILLWVGGGGYAEEGFASMVRNHSSRKIFIRSLKEVLHKYKLDGVDLDWEFPRAYNKQRQHFSQLLREIKQEYIRERKDYLLSVAVAAPEGIALFAYDVKELNSYADFVNLMSYDYHFYTQETPFTGLNAPLYARKNERSIMGTFNINYSVNWWLTNGLDRQKLVVGLPTYGHSFTLVNPFNNKIGAPASHFGQCGNLGFTTYFETCVFEMKNVIKHFYDEDTCSPYINSGAEWISYENERSLQCKTDYIKSMKLGGAMIFSLNSDDYKNVCYIIEHNQNTKFPLIEAVKNNLYQKV